ncbi:hypothetical protein K488DRAFT_41996 [Vararia minispora EC-137]|uniref:Uncharacterized protein n=1 Tax=Vararia minispora EC-137 TaxID=1314806 RepID=A0ACB8QXM0_9AGAM|nr:hypothetical protein K488DRAFT_41996 [Vararia minispora EC-137]
MRERSATVDDPEVRSQQRHHPQSPFLSCGYVLQDSDIGSGQENGDGRAGKPGRKKNPNSQAARRDQNRIAQREFRLRKQQRIRDLEARVEILSGGEDKALGEMRNILKDLMAENHVLRGLLRSLSSFIGEGAGGLLPKLGWTMRDFENYINKSETDTAYESFQRRKQETQPVGRKRSAEEAAGEGSNAGKRARAGDHVPEGFPALMPVNPIAPGGIFPPGGPANGRSPQESALLTDLMRPTNGSPMFNMPGPAGSPQFNSGPGGPQFPPSYMAPMSLGVENTLPPIPFVQGASSSQANEEDRVDPKSEEAQKLISYHLDNYKRNSQYCLPTSLRPTLVQRTVPHESVIDRIPHPELRDRLILLRGQFNLVDCLHDFAMGVTIHGDDVLAHANWEVSESWLRKYCQLVDKATLAVTNKWRRERGAPELTMTGIGAHEGQGSTTPA